MTARAQLFDDYPGWLSHTLAHPDSAPTGRSAGLPDGSQIELTGPGMLRLVPAMPVLDRRLIVSAGVHGNETAPIEVLDRLVEELLTGTWAPATETLLILGNPPAMVAGRRFLDHNLNRLFNGAHRQPVYAGSPESARAALLEQTCEAFASGAEAVIHYDLHTAIRPSKREKFALYPYVPDRQVPADQLRFLAASEVHTLLLQHKEGTTFSAFSANRLGAESMTIELGQVRPFGQNDLDRFAGIEDSLRRLMAGEDPGQDSSAGSVAVFEVVEEIINTGEQFRFHVTDDVANFTEYGPGELIWEDDQQQYRVGDQPEAIVFPNREVPRGHRVGLLVRRQRPGA